MTSILEKLYFGEISPCSQPTPTTERYLKAKNEVEQLGEKILAKYPDCKELLESYADAIHVTAVCEGLQDFGESFRLGALITTGCRTEGFQKRARRAHKRNLQNA